MKTTHVLSTIALSLLAASGLQAKENNKPNIIFFFADDLGYGELGCYGQKKIKTPHIDQLAEEGMKFTQFYSGQNVCAPSRCALLTGKHMGHAAIRENSAHLLGKPEKYSDPDMKKAASRFQQYKQEDGFPGQLAMPASETTVAELLQDAGYTTACIGKWGLGHPKDEGSPHRHGFDFFYGYICQRNAHNYYPTYLWKNDQKVTLPGNDRGLTGETYAADVMEDEALAFIKRSKDKPFFLYYATPVPHVALQVPEDEPSLAKYRKEFGKEEPYVKGAGYLPNKTPRATYAAMITRMDRTLGKMRTLLKELDLDDKTVVIFSSDNGATFNGGYDRAFFEGNGLLRGKKCDLYEGGIRVPAVVKWTGKIKANSSTDHVAALWDFLPTACDIAGVKAPAGIDGISFVPALTGADQPEHKYLYWESRLTRGQQVIRMGDWKGIRENVMKSGSKTPLKLYNLAKDIGESEDVAQQHPEVVAEIEKLMRDARVPNKLFPMGALEKEYK
ncbi:arylsulfatase [Verrucomicrobiaceae bacterium N1E253]|uniref:Arylsulfatase n=1 Tax=Oceaniferula marina TaxID=2748318 RepID=A0A851GRP2_9BACT|nr:arylsulfatase [Oceaniferula marina]NWK57440.1 arylsulfatase [Oceaniferula marina]